MGSYDGFLRADPQPEGTEFDGWLRAGVADGSGPTFLDVLGGAKATAKAGGPGAAIVSLTGGASAGSGAGGAVSALITQPGGAKVAATAGGTPIIITSLRWPPGYDSEWPPGTGLGHWLSAAGLRWPPDSGSEWAILLESLWAAGSDGRWGSDDSDSWPRSLGTRWPPDDDEDWS